MDDVLIVGSGFGGSLTAFELAQAGARVRMLERGPWRDTEPMRQAGIEPRAPLPIGRHFFSHVLFGVHHRFLPARGLRLHRHGLLEFFVGNGIRVGCASGVGGGSQAYGGLMARPLRPDYWDGWADTIDSETMETHYRALLALFAPRTAPPAQGHDIAVRPGSPFVDIQPQDQPAWAYQPPAGGTVDFDREGVFGSPSGVKVTLDRVCLVPAMANGLQVESGQEVLSIQALIGGGFKVLGKDLASGRERSWSARRVVVAAGTVNSVKLLLRSRQAGGLSGMPALGQGFGSNGDYIGQWPVKVPDTGQPQAGIYARLFRHWDDPYGPLFMQGGFAGVGAIPMPGWLKRRVQRIQGVGAMGADAANGTIDLKGERLGLHYDMRSNPVFARIEEHMAELHRLSGVRPRLGSVPSTVHPLGGARLGRDKAASVVDGHGQVHDIPGLYVSDASALPAAPGGPPSLTVAAWSRHVAQGLIAG